MICYRKIRIVNYIYNNIHSICVYALIILCVSLAILTSKNQLGNDLLSNFCNYFNSKNNQSNIVEYCLLSYESSSLAFWLILLLSFSPIGLLVPWIVIAIKTYGISLVLCNLYMHYHIKGIIFGTLIILPGSFLSLYSLIYFLPSAMKISMIFCKPFCSQLTENNLNTHIKQYLLVVLKSALILFTSLIFDFIISELFMAYKLFFS